MKTIKVLELFAGIGAPSRALKNMGVQFETVDMVENNKHAVSAYNIIHNKNYEVQDIRTWDKETGSINLLWASPPCTAFSSQGNQKGGEDKKNGMDLWIHTIRIFRKTKPDIFIMENVPNLLNKKFKTVLDYFLQSVRENLDYSITIRVINAKDCGVPQNRKRLFIICQKLTTKKILFKSLDLTPNIPPKNLYEIIENLVIGEPLEFGQNIKKETPYKGSIITTPPKDSPLWNELGNRIIKIGKLGVKFNSDNGYYSIFGIAPTITTSNPQFKNKIIWLHDGKPMVRDLSLYELTILMGFDNDDLNKLRFLNRFPMNQFVKCLGNSVSVEVCQFLLDAVFENYDI